MNQPQVVFDESEAALSDEELYDRAKTEGGESFPVAVADRLLAGQNPISVYREHRGMTHGELASAAGISVVCLSRIEAGGSTASARTLAALAEALKVSVGDLM